MDMSSDFLDLKPAEIEDILRGLLGKQLGYGAYRAVFPIRGDKKRVAKIELSTRNFDGGSSQNRMEYEVWDQVKDSSMARWFAPVYEISPSGLLLIQARTTPAKLEELPKRIPRCFWDSKIQNWGWLNGRVVCHDYGMIDIGQGIYRGGLKKAKWWDGTKSS